MCRRGRERFGVIAVRDEAPENDSMDAGNNKRDNRSSGAQNNDQCQWVVKNNRPNNNSRPP